MSQSKDAQMHISGYCMVSALVMDAVGKRVGGISTINPFLPCFESTSKAYKQVKME